MGRPLNKKNFGPDSRAIAITAYRRRGEAEVDGTAAFPGYATDVWIKRQASTRDFVLTNGTWEERMTMALFDTDTYGEFGSLEEGTFIMSLNDPSLSEAASVTKLSQNHYTGGGRGSETEVVWANNENLVRITDITAADPGVATAPDGHGFEDGDYVLFLGDYGMEELWLLGVEVTVIDDTTFSIGDTAGNTAFDGEAWATKLDYTGGPVPIGTGYIVVRS